MEKKFNRKFSRILDCGCGIGRHAIPLAKLGYKVTGLDSSKIYIQYAKKWARSEGVKVNFIVGDMRKIPFSKNEFDVVLSLWTTFGYFSEEENMKVLREFRRVLRKNGLIVLDVPNREYLDLYFSPIYCEEKSGFFIINYNKKIGKRYLSEWKIYKKIGDELNFVCKKVSKVRLYTLDELKEISKKLDLKIIEIFSGFSFVPFERSSKRILIIFMT